MSHTPPEQQLKAVLAQAQALLNLSAKPHPPTAKPSLAAVLHSRLDAYLTLAPSPPLQEGQPPPNAQVVTPKTDLSERALQRDTARAALTLLERTASLLPSLPPLPQPSSAPSTSSAPSRTAAPPPPVFGIGDAKALGQLAAVIGRWGIQDPANEARTPGRRGAHTPPKIVELGEEEVDVAGGGDAARQRREVVCRVVRGVLGVDSEVDLTAKTPGEKQFLGTVLPQLLGPLVGALADLGDEGDEGSWAREALERVFKLCVCLPLNPLSSGAY